MSTNVSLTPELERFARQCVTEGRYNNVSEVVRSALRMLQDQEERRRAFVASLDEARAEAERDGYVTIEELSAEAEQIAKAVVFNLDDVGVHWLVSAFGAPGSFVFTNCA